ncbi:Hsp20 family protein [Geoglobus acetivorans]|uniref:Hsp20/alpha crystallin family protein n=1 Tax=Geoglobus acetivorans TaxID=565033 RepID=A0ABZ3H2M2_GEOAI|nr:Hsp20/alpha crystallin family protein [Geoglobus acetivorans]
MRTFDPFDEVRRLQERMVRLLDEFDRFAAPAAEKLIERLGMPVDVIDEGDKFRIVADLPGFDKNDIEIYIEDGDLVIKAVRKEEKEEKDRNFLRRERSFGEVYRRISLPADVQEDRIRARYNNGVLEIEVPKTQRDRKIIRIE